MKFNKVLLLIFLISSCSKLLLFDSKNTKNNVVFKVVVDDANKSNLIFLLENKTKDTIQTSPTIYGGDNSLTVFTPSGKLLLKTPNPSVRNIFVLPNDSYQSTYKGFDETILSTYYYQKLDWKETGNYRCIWENTRLGAKTEFYYYFDFEKTRLKYGAPERIF